VCGSRGRRPNQGNRSCWHRCLAAVERLWRGRVGCCARVERAWNAQTSSRGARGLRRRHRGALGRSLYVARGNCIWATRTIGWLILRRATLRREGAATVQRCACGRPDWRVASGTGGLGNPARPTAAWRTAGDDTALEDSFFGIFLNRNTGKWLRGQRTRIRGPASAFGDAKCAVFPGESTRFFPDFRIWKVFGTRPLSACAGGRLIEEGQWSVVSSQL
jgi:hypothetical protein